MPLTQGNVAVAWTRLFGSVLLKSVAQIRAYQSEAELPGIGVRIWASPLPPDLPSPCLPPAFSLYVPNVLEDGWGCSQEGGGMGNGSPVSLFIGIVE